MQMKMYNIELHFFMLLAVLQNRVIINSRKLSATTEKWFTILVGQANQGKINSQRTMEEIKNYYITKYTYFHFCLFLGYNQT